MEEAGLVAAAGLPIKPPVSMGTMSEVKQAGVTLVGLNWNSISFADRKTAGRQVSTLLYGR